MREADLADELELRVLAQRRDRLGDLEHGADDVVARVPQIPELLQGIQRALDVALVAGLQHGLHLDGVGRVHDLEDVVAAHEAEARVRALQVVDGLAHVALGAEHERRHALVVVLDAFGGDDLQEALDDLGVGEPAVPQDGAAGLQGLDDLVGLVAGEGEARRVRVDLHRAAQGLLRAGRHAVCLVEDHEFVAARGEGDFLLGEAFDSVAHDVDACCGEGLGRVYPRYACRGTRGGAFLPRSSLAFNSNTASLYASPSNCRARHSTLVVLPIPGMPEMMTWGMLPSFAMIFSRSIVSVLPTTSSRKTGRYFSTLMQQLSM